MRVAAPPAGVPGRYKPRKLTRGLPPNRGGPRLPKGVLSKHPSPLLFGSPTLNPYPCDPDPHLLCPLQDAEIVRTRDPEKLAACDIVVDVGGEYDPQRHRYDHHQR